MPSEPVLVTMPCDVLDVGVAGQAAEAGAGRWMRSNGSLPSASQGRVEARRVVALRRKIEVLGAAVLSAAQHLEVEAAHDIEAGEASSRCGRSPARAIM